MEQFKDFVGFVDDDTILSALEKIEDIEMRIVALQELLRNVKVPAELHKFDGEISRTFGLFFGRIAKAFPDDSQIDLLREYALPHLHLKLPSREPLWKWPIVVSVPHGAEPWDGTFREFSALKMFGYTVGKTNGWPKNKRESFLNDFMRLELPLAVVNEFGNEYGSPMSTTRLKKMADVIASNCQLRYRNDPRRFEAAIHDWESDLEYLKRVFYDKAGLKFSPWPDPKDI